MKLNPRISHQKNMLLCFLGLLICYVFTVQIVAATSLDVHVVDVDNQPVNNLVVFLSPQDSEMELSILTNGDGKCTFEGLENKVYEVILQPFDHDYYPIEDPIQILEGINTYDLVVRRKAGLTIQIQYEDGSPADSTRVALEGDSGTYKEVVAVGRMTNLEGKITYPEGVPEDDYTIIIRNKEEKELARHTQTITSSQKNRLKYTIEKPSTIPSYPLLSVAGGIAYWISRRKQNKP